MANTAINYLKKRHPTEMNTLDQTISHKNLKTATVQTCLDNTKKSSYNGGPNYCPESRQMKCSIETKFYQNGDYYNGYTIDGIHNGYGEYYYSSKSKEKFFKGFFKDGLKHGYGYLELKNGSSFYGLYQNDVLEGKGASNDVIKDVQYCGEFKNGKYNGDGKLINKK